MISLSGQTTSYIGNKNGLYGIGLDFQVNDHSFIVYKVEVHGVYFLSALACSIAH